MAKKKPVKKSTAGRQPLRGKKKEVMAITLTPEAIEFINSIDKSRGEAVEDIIRESDSFRKWRSRGKRFAWDKFLGQCLYKDLRELLPTEWPTVPSMYSPDRSMYLASSIDLTFDLSDSVMLKAALSELLAIKSTKDVVKSMQIRADVFAVVEALEQLGVAVNSPESYFQGK